MHLIELDGKALVRFDPGADATEKIIRAIAAAAALER